MKICPNMGGFKQRLALSVLSGVLIALVVDPFSISFFCFVAVVPLLFAFSGEKSFWRLLAYAWVAVFVQSLISFQWVHFVTREFGSLSWGVSFLALIAFALFTNFYLQIFALLLFLFRKKSVNVSKTFFYLLVVPALYAISETVDPRIFSWNIGDALSTYRYMPQFANILGVHGLSFLCLMVNASVFLAINELLVNKRKKKNKIALFVSISLLIPLFLNVYGMISFDRVESYQKTCPILKAGVVQANIGNPVQLKINEAIKFKKELGIMEGDDDSDSALIFGKYVRLSRDLVSTYPDVNVVVWPETAFPGYYNPHNPKMSSHIRLVKELNIPFFIGGYYYEHNRGPGRYYNSAILVTTDGNVEYYHKHVLLPFGEFMPLGSTFPSLKNVVPAVGDFARGQGPAVVKMMFNNVEAKFAPAICYEVLNSFYVRDMVVKGANIILNLTNDSWFGVVEPYQHLRLTRMRAIENSRPIIRTTNTGITAFIDMNGQMVKNGGLLKEELLKFDVPVCNSDDQSFYTKYGWLFVYFISLLCALFYVYQSFVKKRR